MLFFCFRGECSLNQKLMHCAASNELQEIKNLKLGVVLSSNGCEGRNIKYALLHQV